MSANPARKLARAATKRAAEGKVTLPPPDDTPDPKQKFERREVLLTAQQVGLISHAEAQMKQAQQYLEGQAAMMLAAAGIAEGRIAGMKGRMLQVDVPVKRRSRRKGG